MVDKERSQKHSEEYWSQPSSAVRFITPEPEVSGEEIMRMAVDITNGAVEPPRGYNEAHREAWATLLREINEIRARGGVVEIPEDIP